MNTQNNTPKTAKLQKSIEVSKRRIAEYAKKAEMYRSRFEKNNELGLNLNDFRTDYDGTKATFVAIWKHDDKVCENWRAQYENKYGKDEGYCKYCDLRYNAEYYAENIHNGLKEQHHLAELESQLSAANAVIAEQKAKEENPDALRKVLVDLMADFKKHWFDVMIKWKGDNYDYVWENKPMWRRWIDRKQRLHCNYYRQFHFKHTRLEMALEEKEKRFRKCLSSEALGYKNKDEYMAHVELDLIHLWSRNMNYLVEKCEKYDIDLDKIEIRNPSVGGKGFSVLIFDGKQRVIDVRTIWAAEYSEIVEPHTRYIITERKIKGGVK